MEVFKTTHEEFLRVENCRLRANIYLLVTYSNSKMEVAANIRV